MQRLRPFDLARIACAAILIVSGPARTLALGSEDRIVIRHSVDADKFRRFQVLFAEIRKRTARFPGKAAVVVRDLKTYQTVSVNSSDPYPSASLVKIPLMAVCYLADQEGRLSLNEQIPMRRDLKERSCSKLWRTPIGTSIQVKRLIELMITQSDNTATNMLVDELGFDYINDKFRELGLVNTDLRRGVMDLEVRDQGVENYTTADDMAYLLQKMYKGELVNPYASWEMLETLKRQEVNDRIPRQLPGELTIAHKTGLLNDTVSDVGIVYTPEGDFIICVLTAGINCRFGTAKRFIGRVAASAYNICYNNLMY